MVSSLMGILSYFVCHNWIALNACGGERKGETRVLVVAAAVAACMPSMMGTTREISSSSETSVAPGL